MPRLNLTDDEAALIERIRTKNAANNAWNDALKFAASVVDKHISSMQNERGELISGTDLYGAAHTINCIKDILKSAMRDTKIS